MLAMAAPMSLPRFSKVIHDQEQTQETKIPNAFANKYWKRISNPIFLQLSSGAEWTIFWEKRDNGEIWLQKNWKFLAQLHSLRSGSLLVFDHTGESRFQVSIFNPDTVERKYDSEAPMSSWPRFFKVIHDPELKEETRIPKAIAKRYWKGLSNPIFLRLPNGDEWEIFWEKHGDDDIWLKNNWKKFAQFYSLKFGSLLVLDHKGEESRFEVSIFNPSCVEIAYPREHDSEGRDHEEVDEESDDDSVQILEQDSETITQTFKRKKTNSNGEPKSAPTQRTSNNGKRKINVGFDATQPKISGLNRGGKALIKAISRNFRSKIKNPFCVVIMTANYLDSNLLVIPSDFSRKHLYGLEGTATIIGVGEDLTSTRDVSFKFNNVKERIKLTTGWRSFAQDNNLQVGDACVFEMIQAPPVVTFKVHVQSSSDEQFQDSGSPVMEPADTFEITVKPCYPTIPSEFTRRHSTIAGNSVKLKVGENLWDVKVKKYPRHVRISGGWREFVRGCELNVGDVCVFKMVDEEKLEFEVSFIKCQQ